MRIQTFWKGGGSNIENFVGNSGWSYLSEMLKHGLNYWFKITDDNGCTFWLRPKPQAPAVIPGFTQTAHDEFTEDSLLTEAEQADADEQVMF